MKKSNHERLRKLLRGHPLGMTISQMLEAVPELCDGSMRRSLETMPDAYIVRWTGPVRGQWVAVWRVVDVPPNAPKPGTEPAVTTRPVQIGRTHWVKNPPWMN